MTPDNISGVPHTHQTAGRLRLLIITLLVMGYGQLALASPNPVVAPAGAGQRSLAVGLFNGSELRVQLCATPPCDPSRGDLIQLPAGTAALADSATLDVLSLGQGRHVVWLKMPDPANARAYEALLAAPLRGAAPLVLFQGFTGLVEGQYGARQGPMLFISEQTRGGERRVVIGKQYEEIALCGRPTVLAPQLLNPRDLKLYPAKVQRLAPSERNQAVRLMAARLDASAKLGPALLRAAGASSAVGSPQSLTDGNLSTTWAEQRGAEGRGEFIVFNAPPQLPIAGLDFVVKPMGGDAPAAGVAVREFWLVTADRVRHVLMPEDAWQGPGGVYRVMLDQPVQTSCIALVIESAFGTGQDQQVTFTEVTAISEFNPDDLPGLVGALAGGGQRAEAAKTVLMSGGPEAFRAVANAYRTLDEGGRRVALAVMDQASCEVATPTYVRALLSRYEAHASHAKERLRRCARKSADYLVETLRVARPRAWVILANELGLIAPDRAVSEIARLFDASSKARRSSLRVAFARAAMDRSAEPAVQRLLLDTKLPQTSRLEALRSLGSAAEQFGDAADGAFASLAQNRDFRTRFLLLQPAASLSLSNAKARFFLSEALTKDPNPHMRYGAAVAAGGVGHLQNELIHATKDRAVRVRKAAVEALGHRRVAAAEAALVRRLVDDRWPMVRSVAAEALGGLGSSAEADEALARALKDASPIVRAPVVQALGRRRVASAAPDLRDRLEDDDEDAAVRRAAAQALGRLCDYKSLDSLTELAVRRSDPLLDQQQRGLALAALEALAALGPSDLRQRLRPLFSAGAAPGARAAAERVLGMQPGCSVR